jgi:hypothetical protein
MKFGPPMPQQPVVERGMFTSWWATWLQRLHAALGFSPAQPVYQTFWEDAAFWDETAVFGLLPFDPDADDLYVGGWIAPNNYVNGSTLKPFLIWFQAGPGLGNLLFSIDIFPVPIGSAIADYEHYTFELAAADNTAHARMVEFDDIVCPEIVKGTPVKFIVSREGADADDDFADWALVMGVGWKYQVEGIGHERAHP